MANAHPNLNLIDLVTSIRDELEQIDTARMVAGKKPLFHLTRLELELKFVAVENSGIKSGFDIKVVSLGGDIGMRSEEVHTVKLTFDVPSEAGDVLGARARGSQYNVQDIIPLE